MYKTTTPADVYILPSEALDLDALASSILFAEIWQTLYQLPVLSPSKNIYHRMLQILRKRYPTHKLHCIFPLLDSQELLWRKDICYLLQFLGQLYQCGDQLTTLEYILNPKKTIYLKNTEKQNLPIFTLKCPDELAAFVLIDRHHLPDNWQKIPEVIAIWDHRPDSLSLPQVQLRCIKTASSCAALLLDCANQLKIFPYLSEAALILAMGALYLDKQEKLLLWEKPIWQQLCQKLARDMPYFKQQQLQYKIYQERNTPNPDLFQQVNTDVKILSFINNAIYGSQIRVAIAVIPTGIQIIRKLYKKGELENFFNRCTKRHQADFLIILHRQSPQNIERTISFLFYSDNRSPIFSWNLQRVNIFLGHLQQWIPSHRIYSNEKTNTQPKLVQWKQNDQSLNRKYFMNALRQSFQENLLNNL